MTDERIEPAINLGLKEGRIESGDQCFTYKISPKADLGSLLSGDFKNAFGKTKISLKFKADFEQDDVQVIVMVNSNLAAIMDSPKGSKKFDATVCATKKF